MALIVITVQDTPGGATVALAAEPPMDLSALPAGKAQEFAYMMLAALPVNAPGEPEKQDPAEPIDAALLSVGDPSPE